MEENMQKQLEQLTKAYGENAEALKVLAAVLKQQQEAQKQATTHTAIRLHGTGGIFSAQGVERDVITAYVRPHGVASALPVLPSIDENPFFPSITGFTATIGSQPSNACEAAPYGYMKGCDLTARFGLRRFDTNTIEMDKVMLRINRGDFTDLMLRGDLLTQMGLSPENLTQEQAVNIITMAEMVTVGVNMERQLSQDIWQGTVAGGWGPGLDVQINTGQVDAHTGTACPALDSDVKDFNYNNVCGTTLDIVEQLSMMMWYLQYNATHMGHDPVQWVIAMRPELWFELSACWPCKYLTNRCVTANVGFNAAVINDNVNVAERDRMRNSMVIPINGVDFPVITDVGIFEHNNANNANLAAGQFASSIYAVPLTIRGGFRTTYMEYIDYRQAQADVNLLRGTQEFFWTDNGRYSWAVEQTRWCYMLSLKTEQRVILRTPQLAGKIQRVMYTPLQHLREPYADSPYFYDGGVSLRAAPTVNAVWLP